MDVNNQGLNIPSNLQNLDVRDELLSKEVGSGVNCAYSLRDLTGSNLNCVRVRREPEDTTNSIDDEKIFSAQAVTSKEVEDWVNGKLENTLPVDIDSDNCAGAYSLRKVKASYSGNALRIRRTSDNTEVDVAFDSNDKVSSSSTVTNVTEQGGESGSTNSTELNGFLNEEHEITNTSSTLDNKSASGVQGTVNEASSTLIDFTVTALETSGGSATTNMWLFKSENHNQPSIGKIRISLDCTHFDFENGGNLFIQPLYDHDGNGSNSYANAITINGTGSYSVEIDLTTRQTTQAFRIFRGDVAVGDRVRIENLKIESLKTSATVHTWYDQAGSNDATQSSADDQPTIANNGSLILDDNNLPVIDDLGNGNFLEFTNFIYSSSDTSYSFFMKLDKKSQTTGTYWLLGDSETGASRGGGSDRGWKVQEDRITHYFNIYEGDQNFDQGYGDWAENSVLAFIAKSDNTTYQMFNNAVQLGSDSTKGSDRYHPIKRIFQASDSNTSNDFQGTLSELIFYNSDQTDNRFKIESNINNYYGLYNDANDTSDTEWQFHNTETGTSANGTDGYVFKNSDADVGIASLELKEGVVSGDVIYYSFFYDRTTGSPTVRLASDETDSSSSVSNNDAVGTVTGFISGTLTATGTGSFFMIADNDNPSDFTISNFRMSRIARNGFVETWYDQSGNDKHLSQVSASNQPKIILNGGQDITDGLHFDNDQTLGENSGGTPNQSSAFFTFVARLDATTTRPTLVGGNADVAFNATPDVLFRANSSNTRTATSPDVNIIVGQQHLISLEVTSLTPTVYVDDGSHTLADLTANVGPTFKILGGDTGSNATYALNGRMNEAIAFDGDKSTDVSAIRLEQNNYYNIY